MQLHSHHIHTFKEVIRLYMLRMLAVTQQSSKFALMQSPQDLDIQFSRLLHLEQIKESTIYQLTNAQIKSDQHYLLLLSLVFDLTKWCTDTIENNQVCNSIDTTTVKTIISQSIHLSTQDKKHNTLINKQKQLISAILILIPTSITIITPQLFQQFIQFFTISINLLKEVKDINKDNKEEIKKTYGKSIEEAIKSIGQALQILANRNEQNKNEENKGGAIWIQRVKNLMKLLEAVDHNVSQEISQLILVFKALNNLEGQISTSQVNTISVQIFPQLYTIYNTNFSEFLLPRLKIQKAILKCLSKFSHINGLIPSCNTQLSLKLSYHEDIIHKYTHNIIEINYFVKLSNYHILTIIFSLYQELMDIMINKQSIAPLYLYTHIIINNLKLLLHANQSKSNITTHLPISPIIPNLHIHTYPHLSGLSSSSYLASYSQLTILETILTYLSDIFKQRELSYFLELYDWNFMQQDICLQSIKYLYEFIQNSNNENRIEYELFKKCLVVINKRIETFLQNNQYYNNSSNNSTNNSHNNKPNKQTKQFYELKKKQYYSIVDNINKKPKNIFKNIAELAQNGQIEMKQDYIQKCVRILKKSKHIQHRSMIDVLASSAKQSQEILHKYIETFFEYNNKHIKYQTQKQITSNLEHFLRQIISNFCLTGESQQIIRFLDKITREFYAHQSPSTNIFKNSDAVYTFANAIIILNTDQHNPKNQNKMNLDSFVRMCGKINAGQDLDVQIIKQTFTNIKNSEILTFRNRYNIQKISLDCWLQISNDYESVKIGYYDDDVAELYFNKNKGQTQTNFCFKEYANQLLLAVIDQKQTQKLQIMVQRFEYDDQKFDCEIIEKIRQMINNKRHVAMHILQKIYEVAQFNSTKKIDDKIMSYCWLACGIIQNFHNDIPYSKMTEFILKTWRVGFQIKDNLSLRQNLQLKIIKKMIKNNKKKQNKKSIINMFSKFLSAKNSQSQSDENENSNPSLSNSHSSISSNGKKKANVINSSFIVFQTLMKSNDSRTRAAQAILFSLRHQQARRYEQFFSCLYLIFHFIYGSSPSASTPGNAQQQNSITLECLQIILNLLFDFYGMGETNLIGTRVSSLKSKNESKYELIYTYVQFWTLKIILTWLMLQKQINIQLIKKVQKVFEKCSGFLSKASVEVLTQLLNVIDQEGITTDYLISVLRIPKNIIDELLNATLVASIKPKYIHQVSSQGQIHKQQQQSITKSKSQPNLSQINEKKREDFEDVQKYMRELRQNDNKSETHATTKIDQQLTTSKIQETIRQIIKDEQSESNILKNNVEFTQNNNQETESAILREKVEQNEVPKAEQQQNIQKMRQQPNQTCSQDQTIHNQQKQTCSQQPQSILQSNEQANQNLQDQDNHQNDLDEQKKQSDSNEQLGFPVYML